MKSSSGYEIYHNTLSSCLDEIERYVESKGYTIGDYFPEVNHVSYGTTARTSVEMLKNGNISNSLAVQIYRMDSGKYELNCYPVRKFAKGDLIEKTMHEFKHGQLHSSSGDTVTNPKQAIAIGLSKERRGKFEKGGYTRPPHDMPIYGVYKFSSKIGDFILKVYHFERNDDTTDSLEIQDELRPKLGSIIIKNSAWKRLSKGLPIKAKTDRGNYNGTLIRLGSTKDANKFVVENVKFATGGMVDLFEDYEKIPPKVQAILDDYVFRFGTDFSEMEYLDSAKLKQELNAVGYTFDSGLDNVPYALRPINVPLNKVAGYEDEDNEQYGKGGGLKLLKVGNKYLYKFNNTKYKILGIGEKQVALVPLVGHKRNWIISKGLMQKWVQENTMQKIK
jgi:hypothetical protein